MVDGVKNCSEVQEDEDSEVAGFCGQEDVVGDFRRAVSVLCWEWKLD